jgi:hypothetical protein
MQVRTSVAIPPQLSEPAQVPDEQLPTAPPPVPPGTPVCPSYRPSNRRANANHSVAR